MTRYQPQVLRSVIVMGPTFLGADRMLGLSAAAPQSAIALGATRAMLHTQPRAIYFL
jgi:hypothetical protein